MKDPDAPPGLACDGDCEKVKVSLCVTRGFAACQLSLQLLALIMKQLYQTQCASFCLLIWQ